MKKLFFLFLLPPLWLACSSDEEKAQKALVQEATLAGDQITAAAFQALSGHLKNAMVSGGVENAISYCNVNALPLTDSLSQNFGVKIKRTSNKLRNPANKADSLENYIVSLYKDIQAMRKPMVGKAILTKDMNVRYFAPIVIKPQCLTCHGTVGEQVTDSTYTLIKARYPGDEATGYEEGELRGLWSVDFGDLEHTKQVIAGLDAAIPEIKD